MIKICCYSKPDYLMLDTWAYGGATPWKLTLLAIGYGTVRVTRGNTGADPCALVVITMSVYDVSDVREYDDHAALQFFDNTGDIICQFPSA